MKFLNLELQVLLDCLRVVVYGGVTGDNPQTVKTRLRHWAQAVACSVRQIC